MALIKLSSFGITAISGKAGGSVYSRNRGGEYVKNFVMPTNTFSEARQAVRAVFGAISSGWRLLTSSQRNSWVEAAPLYLRTNTFGDQKQLSPHALFVGQNQNLANADLPMIDEIGAPQGTNGIVGITSKLNIELGASPEFSFSYGLENDNSSIVPANDYVLEATPGYNDSRKNVENLFRKFATTAGDGTQPAGASITSTNFAATDADLLAAYIAKFGTPNAGDVVSIRIKAVNPQTGEVSASWQDSNFVLQV